MRTARQLMSRRFIRHGSWMIVFILLWHCIGSPVSAAGLPNAAAGLADGRAASLADARFTQLVAGSGHTCGLTPAGAVECWGSNWAGQLGDGTNASSGTPVSVQGLSGDVIALAAGINFNCALLENGTVQCWGENGNGQLGDGTSNNSTLPVAVSGLSGVSAIGAGGHACAVLSDQTVQCWGWNDHGQLGDGTTTDAHTPVAVVGLAGDVVAVEAGITHTCALLEGDGVQCWGNGQYGQLGNGADDDSGAPVTVAGLSNVSQLSARRDHTCAVLNDGTIQCWGGNWSGQLGDGTRDNHNSPVEVVGLAAAATDVLAAGGFSCALLENGSVQCWGANEMGQLGNGTFVDSLSPVTVANTSSGMTALGGEYSHACASGPAATICWGANWEGELGDGVAMIESAPRDVSGLNNNIRMLSGGSNTCALDSSGVVKCWGSSWAGQLGNGTWNQVSSPTLVTGLDTPVKSIHQFFGTICALNANNGVQCWGLNDHGQVGNGTTNTATTPVDVSGLQSGVSALTAGWYHNCALLADGTARCWGMNNQGQLGNGTTVDSSTPVAVSGLSGILALSAGGEHTCALLQDRTVRCWGGNYDGQLGNGSNDTSLTPVTVPGLSGVTSLESSLWNTCAITGAGAVQCWGSNHSGQLGNDDDAPSNLPVAVDGLSSGVTALAGGNDHFCAIKDSAVWCWGGNQRAQSGSGLADDPLRTPAPVTGLAANVSSVEAGGDHSCAVASGRAKCWGNNSGDMLGLGRTLFFATPVAVLPVDEPPVNLQLNYASGAPDSIFTLRGTGFSASQSVTVSVIRQANPAPIRGSAATAETIQQVTVNSDAYGTFVLFLDTRNAAPGSYRIEAIGGSQQAAGEVALSSAAPLRAQEGGGAVISVQDLIYLPMMRR